MNLGRFKLDYNYSAGQTGWGNAFNNNFKKLSQLVDLTVVDIVSSTPTTANINDSYVNTAKNTIDVFYAVNAYDSYQIADFIGKIIHVQAADAVYYINNNSQITTVADLSTVYTKTESDDKFLDKNEKTILGKVAYDTDSYIVSDVFEGFATTGANLFTFGYVHFVPFFLKAGTYTEAAFYVHTASANSSAIIALYDSDSITKKPKNLLVQSGSIDTTTTGLKTASGSIVITEPGLYYAAIKPEKVGATFGVSTGVAVDSLNSTNTLQNTLKTAHTRGSVVGYYATNQTNMPSDASLITLLEITTSSSVASQNAKNILLKRAV